MQISPIYGIIILEAFPYALGVSSFSDQIRRSSSLLPAGRTGSERCVPICPLSEAAGAGGLNFSLYSLNSLFSLLAIYDFLRRQNEQQQTDSHGSKQGAADSFRRLSRFGQQTAQDSFRS